LRQRRRHPGERFGGGGLGAREGGREGDLGAAVLLEDAGPAGEGGWEASAEGRGVEVGAGVGQARAQRRDLG
jgi:hypothetical protein